MIFDEQQTMIRDMARDFARERLAPNAAVWDREHRFPAEAIREMGELGFMGMLVPEAYGGAGADHVGYALVMEEIAAGARKSSIPTSSTWPWKISNRQ